ncbi:MAG: glycosyltransferase [Ruminococcaceae bacterium]|nr:glycosyltransferase [Oscillospiraceae bacterium]
MSKISVIVPVYNVEKYISSCLDSILSQTHTDLEIICVNDGSTDSSGQILDEYAKKDSRIKVFHKENGGVSSARNLALENATGEYIGFVDSDDYIAPDMYSSLLSNIVDNNADIAECGIAYVTENGDAKNGVSKVYSLSEQKQILKAFFLKDMGIVIWNKIFKSEIVNNQRFNENYKIGEDSLFLYNCLKDANKIVGIDTVGYYYLQRESSVMHNVVDKKRLKLFEIVDCWLEENKHDKELYGSVVKRDAVLSVFVMDAALKNRQENTEVIKMLRRRLLSHKNTILTNKNFSVKFKLGTLLLWLCPKLYYSINK